MNKTVLKLGGIILVGAGAAIGYLQFKKRREGVVSEQVVVDVIPPETPKTADK